MVGSSLKLASPSTARTLLEQVPTALIHLSSLRLLTLKESLTHIDNNIETTTCNTNEDSRSEPHLNSGDKAPGKALKLPHNRDRYVPPDKPDDIQSRETTPYPEQGEDDTTKTERAHRLCLTFDRPPRAIGRGFSFGTDK
jgi:hypothetical protein